MARLCEGKFRLSIISYLAIMKDHNMLFYLLAYRKRWYHTTAFSQVITISLSFRRNPVICPWAAWRRVVLGWPFHRRLRDSGKKIGLSDGKSSHVVNVWVVEAE